MPTPRQTTQQFGAIAALVVYVVAIVSPGDAYASGTHDGTQGTPAPAETSAPPTQGDTPHMRAESRPIDGVNVWVKFVHSDAARAKVIMNDLFAEFRRLSRKMKRRARVSEVRSANRHADKEEVILSRETYDLIQRALHLCNLTKGAFDPTVASFDYLWNFNLRPPVKPLPSELKERLKHTGCRKVVLKPNRALRLNGSRMRITMRDLLHGHMFNQGSELLQKRGVASFMLGAGRDQYARGRLGSRHWYMTVPHPNDAGRELVQLYVGSHAVATRSWSDRYFIKRGVRYHDVLDPRTGAPARGVAQVTVVSTDAVLADSLSAAAFALGPKRGVALLNQTPQAEGFIIDDNGRVLQSSGMSNYARVPASIKL